MNGLKASQSFCPAGPFVCVDSSKSVKVIGKTEVGHS